MDAKDVILGLSGLFSGGVLTKVITSYLSKNRDDFQVLSSSWKDEIVRLNTRITEIDNYNKELKKDIAALRIQIATLKQIHPDIPIPLWLKDINGRMLSLNDAYEAAFLIPQGKHRGNYIGKKDADIWGEKVAKVFKEHDDQAILLDAKQQIIFEENDVNPLLLNWVFLKYPKYLDGTLVGVAGIGVPKKDFS